MKASVVVQAIACGSLLCLSTTLCSAQSISNGGLQYMQTINIPGWGQSGATQANYDLLGFNPATRIMYIADRLSKGITAPPGVTRFPRVGRLGPKRNRVPVYVEPADRPEA